MKGRWITWTDQELAWIKAFSDMPRAELHALFVQVWNRPEVTEQNLKSLCLRRGWKTGRTGCFAKGLIPVNKGQKGVCAPGSEKGWFRKGQEPHNTQFLGHERLSKDGYVEISVAETNPHTGYARRYVQKHRWLWEQANGPVPEGHRLKCLDGDKANTAPSNWTALPYAIAPRLNGKYGRGYDRAPAELRPMILAVAKLEHAAREARKGGA